VAFVGVIDNFPLAPARVLARFMTFPLGRPFRTPDDRLGHRVAMGLMEPGATRDRLTALVHLPQSLDEPIGALEAALVATCASEPIEAKLCEAQKAGRFTPSLEALASGSVDAIWEEALAQGVITEAEYRTVANRNQLRDLVIRVDDFPYDFDVKSAAQRIPDDRIARTAAVPPAMRPWPEKRRQAIAAAREVSVVQ
jgi:acyl-CoA dehydrogenase